MRNEEQRARFQGLRDREAQGTLTTGEQAELTTLIQEIEAAEAAALHPATKQLRAERRRVDAQNRALEELLERKERLASRLREVLSAAQAERRQLDDDIARILRENPAIGASR